MNDRDGVPPQSLFFDLSGTKRGPWEIGRPQSVIVELTKRGVFHGEVLDVGCGIADNAIYISQQCPNARITAIDLVSEHKLVFDHDWMNLRSGSSSS